MSYQALYRKYRPQTFAQVVGQAAIVKTLQNAIISKKISHAYLFSGPRGTGKTTIARIFAKALNCENPNNGEPCTICTNCKEISESMNPDVIEIDAASNNGVDEIRDIREKVKFLPSGAKYKIYIIDEVHMLSSGAFNALLKTLEEPPKHVVFILATTEPQKLPATIISRCQRYDFKPLSTFDISMALKGVCEKEEAIITDDAINAISEAAEGGMRDALSILDQVISYGNKDINIEDVNTITGTISFDKISLLLNYIENKNVNFALETINDFIVSGKETSKILSAMLVFCRDILLYKSVGSKNSNKYIFEKEKFQELAFKLPNNKVLFYIDTLCDVQNKVKTSTTPNVYLEIAIIKMCNISDDDLDLMKRMDDLESKVDNVNFAQVTNDNTNSVDNEKLGILDAKINQVVTEFNKLELHKISQRIDDLSQIIANRINNTQDDVIKQEIDNIKFSIENIKNELLVRDGANVEDSKIQDFQKQIDELKKLVSTGGSNNSIDTEFNEKVIMKFGQIDKQIAEFKNIEAQSVNDTIYNEIDELNIQIKELREKSLNGSNDKEFKEKVILKFNQIDNKLSETINNNSDNTNNSDIKSKFEELWVQINELKNRPIITSNNSNDDEMINIVNYLKQEVTDLKDQTSSINRAMDISKNEIDDIILNKSSQNSTNYNGDLDTKIDNITRKINDIYNDIDNLKSHSNDTLNSEYDLSDVKEKLETLESRMYRFIAGAISGKEKVKPVKKPNGQIMLFGDEVLSVDDFEKPVKEKINFGELAKSPEEIEESKINSEEFSTTVEKDEQNDQNEKDEIEINEEISDVSEEEKQSINNQDFIEKESTKPEIVFDFASKIEEKPEPKPEVDTSTQVSMDSLFTFTEPEKPTVKEEKSVFAEPVRPKQKDEIIEQYFDADKKESIINKKNSSLVVREKNENEDEDIDIAKSLLQHENEKQNVIQEDKKEEIIVSKVEEKQDKFANYDIRDVEQILLDSHSIEAKNDKNRILAVWPGLSRGIAPDLISISEIISEGVITAVGNKELIITFTNVTLCNQVMRYKFKKEALKILYSKLGDSYNYIALPADVWKEKRNEYVMQYQIGIRKPTLTPFNIKGLNVIDEEKEFISKEDKTINNAIEFFGDDIVKIEGDK